MDVDGEGVMGRMGKGWRWTWEALIFLIFVWVFWEWFLMHGVLCVTLRRPFESFLL